MIPRKAFYFLRHGETEHNAKQILAGRDNDVPLNSNGIEQAQELKAHIQRLPIQAIYHSPLIRAKQTTEIIAKDLSHQWIQIEELRECLGDVWLSMCRATRTNSPICSSTKAFFAQVMTGIHRVLECTETPLVVAHGGVHFALCHLLSIENHPKTIGNCSLVHFNPSSDTTWEAKKVFSP